MASAFSKVLVARVLYALATNRDIEEFVDEGYTYGQIASLLVDARTEGLLVRDKTSLIVTTEGRSFIERHISSSTRTGELHRILPQDFDHIEKIGITDVYLPSKRSSFFGR